MLRSGRRKQPNQAASLQQCELAHDMKWSVGVSWHLGRKGIDCNPRGIDCAIGCATACATDVNILDRSSERTARDLATLSTTFSYAFRLRTTRKGAGPAAALTILAPNVSSDVRPHVTPRSRT